MPIQVPPELEHAVKQSCCESGCKFLMRDVSGDYVIFKGEIVVPSTAVCDCLIFHKGRDVNMVLVELKSKTINVEKLEEKFEQSAPCDGNSSKAVIANECRMLRGIACSGQKIQQKAICQKGDWNEKGRIQHVANQYGKVWNGI